jgi:dolichol-phosphate mannosyltransferase
VAPVDDGPARSGDRGADATVIIPVLNEAGAIRGVLEGLGREAPMAQVIVADDGSTDGTRNIVRDWSAGHPNVSLLERSADRGLTASVLAALANVATGRVAVMDGDGQHPAGMVPRILSALARSDIAVAVRTSTAGLRGFRKLQTRAGNALARAASRRQGGAVSSDMLSGLFAARTAHFRRVVERRGRYFERPGFKVLFDLLRFSPARTPVAEVPFELSERAGGSSKLSTAQTASFLRQLGPGGRLLAAAVSSRFLRFSAFGAAGVAVNTGIFLALLWAGLPPLLSAGLSAETALLHNFILNDLWTWKRRGASWPVRLGRYHVVGVAGIAINIAVLAAMVRVMPPLPANLIGIAAAVLWGFLANDRWTWAVSGEPRTPLLSDRASLYAISFVVQCVLAALFIHDWDGFVFERTARDLLGGTTPYQTAVSAPPYIFNIYDVPPVPEWYAYPPLPALMFSSTYGVGLLLPFSTPALLRLCLKLPFIAGNLLLARFSARFGGNGRAVGRTELFLLFNPFLIFIGAVWGMFDALMVMFMLGSLLLLRRGKTGLAGAAFGAAALMKLFPLFFLPAALFWAARKRGRAGAARFLAGAAVLAAAVSLPFLVQSPDGFLRQVLLVHLSRPPQGMSLVGLPYYMHYLNDLLGLSLPVVGLREVSLLSVALLAPSLLLAYLVAYRARGEADVLLSFAGIAFALMLFNKVVNEQYLVLPLVFATLYGRHPGASPAIAALARRTALALTAGGVVAGIVIGFHFLTFIPPDTGAALARMFGDYAWTPGPLVSQRLLFIIPAVVAAIAVAPAWILMMGGVEEVGKKGVSELRAMLRRLAAPVAGRKGIGAAASILTVSLLLAPAAGSALLLPSEAEPEYPALPPLKGQVVGTYYYLWWNNPTHDPAKREGNWKDVSQTPEAGYYTNSPAYARIHIRQMKQAGIDVAIVSYHGYDSQELLAFARVCRMEGFRFAVMLELGMVNFQRGLPGDRGYPLDETSRKAILDLAASIPGEVWRSPSMLRLGERPAIFAFDAYFAGLPARPHRDLNRTFVEFWYSLRWSLEQSRGPLFIVGGAVMGLSNDTPVLDANTSAPFDSLYLYSPAFAWPAFRTDGAEANLARWRAREDDLQRVCAERGFPSVFSVMPAYNDTPLRKNGFVVPADIGGRTLYDRLWEKAVSRGPALVAVTSWNEFFEGTAIEPSAEYGDMFLGRTAYWSAKLKEGAADG